MWTENQANFAASFKSIEKQKDGENVQKIYYVYHETANEPGLTGSNTRIAQVLS